MSISDSKGQWMEYVGQLNYKTIDVLILGIDKQLLDLRYEIRVYFQTVEEV
jgi:hypothetical protein